MKNENRGMLNVQNTCYAEHEISSGKCCIIAAKMEYNIHANIPQVNMTGLLGAVLASARVEEDGSWFEGKGKHTKIGLTPGG